MMLSIMSNIHLLTITNFRRFLYSELPRPGEGGGSRRPASHQLGQCPTDCNNGQSNHHKIWLITKTAITTGNRCHSA